MLFKKKYTYTQYIYTYYFLYNDTHFLPYPCIKLTTSENCEDFSELILINYQNMCYSSNSTFIFPIVCVNKLLEFFVFMSNEEEMDDDLY